MGQSTCHSSAIQQSLASRYHNDTAELIFGALHAVGHGYNAGARSIGETGACQSPSCEHATQRAGLASYLYDR